MGGPVRWRVIKQMPAQEGQLSLNGLLVLAEEWLVVPAGQLDEFSPGSTVRRADGRSGERRLIPVADQDQ